mmetsp:Transcript_11528/g.35601  ORF Transcript_11528/g.35601 Transcript_11528/m.35601 type:complete len:212 (+) Transcript_11528:143-778(+)|eukprot:scaffold290516_cov24-Tisochrysis_lutea.AAC.3
MFATRDTHIAVVGAMRISHGALGSRGAQARIHRTYSTPHCSSITARRCASHGDPRLSAISPAKYAQRRPQLVAARKRHLALGSEEGGGAAREDEDGGPAECDSESEEDEQVDPPIVRVNVVLVYDTLGLQLLRLRPVRTCGVPKLVEDEQVDTVLEGAEVLRPAEPDWDLLRRDEEAGEEQLRHKNGRGYLLRHLGVGRKTPDEEGGRGSS